MKQLKLFLILCFVIFYAPANGQKSGKYKDGLTNRDAPLTTFDRGATYAKLRDSIRTYIQLTNDSLHYSYIYAEIYDNANTGATNPSGHCYDAGVCSIAKVAKDAAFVYLMGFDKNGDDLDGIGDPGRQHFYDVAKTVLRTDESYYGSFHGLDNHQWRAKELIQLLQAHDYLVTAKKAGITSYPDYDKVREQLADFTYDLYRHANNFGSTLDRYNNLTLITAGAIGMAACVLSDKGVRFYRIQKKPERWANAAHAYINRTLWTGPSTLMSFFVNAPRSKDLSASCPSCVFGYSEGPGYFHYGFESLLPFFITFQNFVGQDQSKIYYTKATNFSGERVRNYVYNHAFEQNLYKWIKNTSLPNGDYPTIDDTRTGYNMSGTLALTRKTKDKYNTAEYSRLQLNGVAGLQLRQDYLASFNHPVKSEYGIITQYNSGDIVIRNSTDSLPTEHYLHVNTENEANNGGAHEHGDISSFIISAGEDLLAIDPGYNTYEDRDEIADGFCHNLISIDGEGPDPDDYTKNARTKPDGRVEINYSYWNYHLGIATSEKAHMNRNIQPFNEEGVRYYEIDDQVKNNNWFDNEWVQFNLNGNGNSEDGTCYLYSGRDNVVVWDHPCYKDNNNDDNYKMQVSLTTYLDSSVAVSAVTIQNGYTHGNSGGDNNQKYNPDISSNNYVTNGFGREICKPTSGDQGTHTRMRKQVQIGPDHKVQFKATIQILNCDDNQDPPLMVMNSRYTSHLLGIQTTKEFLYNYHFSRSDHSNTLDTAINPLGINGNAVFKTDAKRAFFSYSPNRVYTSGRCISYTNFRKASIIDGYSLIYNDTEYITSDKRSEVYYGLIGKHKYKAHVETDTACTISFYLADMDTGIAMKAEGFTYSYNQTTCIISIDVPVGFSEFEIELVNPCLVSCFFPSTAETIDSVFNFSEGITATLGHKLDIVRPNGLLNITKGSHMIICDGYYLRNKNNLVLWSGCGKDTGQISLSTCDGRATGTPYGSIGGAGSGAVPSRITVKEGAALILEDSSFTHISNNSELHVFGTLVIKNGAKILVGDGRSCSYATVMVYPGAYFHCEDDANLEFFKIIGDTQDRHIFFIANKPTGGGANKGINPSILTLLTNDTIIGSSNIPVEICDLNTVTPTYGIANREWGFSNVLAPKARIKIPNDTICEGECLLIDFTASLNDAIRELEVCRIDTILGLPFTSCFGNKRLSGTTFTNGYDEQDTCWSTEPHITIFPLCDFIDSVDHWYRVHIKVKNHCDLVDTQTVYFYIDSKPNALIDLALEACPGYETVTAHNYSTKNAAEAIWHVHVIDSTQYQENDESSSDNDKDWEVYSLHYGDSFNFPGFKWVGGFKYAVNLTQFNRCGEAVSEWDTVDIQPGAMIFASPATVYSDPLGPSSLQLNAYVGSATSFTWSPTTYLDDPYALDPIATPTDTITYILTATKDNCYAYDTLFVKHNSLAFAGVDSVVCAGSEILTGPNYDAALLFAILKLQGGNDFQTLHDTYYNNDSLFFNDLSLFMITATGKNDMNASGCTQLINYYDGFDRTQFYEQSWYITFYNKYVEQSSHADAFDYFETAITDNPTLSSYLQNNVLWDDFQCINNMLIDYYNYKQNSITNISSTWDVYENDSWTNLPDWNNYIKTTQTINSTTTFKLTIIDNPNGVVEYDQVTYTADTVIQPWFTQLYQVDSTIYFNNISEPVSSSTTYLWDFGDGDSSTEVNPIHTFAAFDSAYKVTLNATNKCGTEIWSDTVRVDSMGIIANLFTIKTKPGSGSNNNLGNINQYNQTVTNKTTQKGITCMSFPNPFDDKTTFIYQIDFPYTKGQLVVNNTLGQSMGNFNFTNNKGVIPIQTEHYAKGMYFYTLFIDGTLVQTGKWMKE